MNVVFDGMSAEAVCYHPKHDPKWGHVIELCCTKCPRIYHIARTHDFSTVSAIIENNPISRNGAGG